ncbi:MAG: type II CRISPR-associated endonuclease Cas1 [Bacteroidales bacterium]|nr:type II CRISPR-associated endonuclease Cas1 [Bacteroidales bacterium]
MIKRTLYFENPAYLSVRLGQLVIKKPDSDETVKTVPIEDIGMIVLDNSRITLTHGLMSALTENNCAVVSCSGSHLPTGLLLPLYCNSIQSERFRKQIDASQPLKKQLWQQTVKAKIHNQAAVLFYTTGEVHNNMAIWEKSVRSGDADNLEARAAAYYWKNIFPDNPGFVRGQFEGNANDLLNYGYAILRAIIARALVGSGLLPTLGIHHHNRYDAYCLADDIMEPYRPYVDMLVYDILQSGTSAELSKESKTRLLSLPVTDVTINGRRSPLMVAATQTSASLAKCFSGEVKNLTFPLMEF